MSDNNKKTLLTKAMDLALDVDRDQARAAVNALKREHRGESPSQLARRLISRTSWQSAGLGLLTGLPGNPWVAVPAAIADAGMVLRMQVQLACRVALLFEPGYLDGGEPPYELLVPIMGKRAAAELMRDAAIRGGMGLTRAAIRKYLRKNVLRQFKRIMLKYFGLKVTQRGLITKTLPLIGGGIGGTWNLVEMRRVGGRVIAMFETGRVAA